MSSLSGTRPKPTRVLLADSDPNTGLLATSIGGKSGYEVVTVKDNREAYWLLCSDNDFKAVVLDMSMPCPDGVDIVRHIKTAERLRQIPVVIVAGKYGLQLITECFAAGAIAFLPKPFTTEQLQRTLHMAISSKPGTVSTARFAKSAAIVSQR